MEKPILDPVIPYVGPIFGGKFGPGRMVRIQGTVPSVAYRFEINLQCGADSPKENVALNVGIHLLDGHISINSLQNGVWGEEQRHVSVPIKRAERFEIILLCDYNQFKIAINGQHYCEFPQRIHYDQISHLSIDGDVSIIQITYETTSIGPNQTGNDDFEMVPPSGPLGYSVPPYIQSASGITPNVAPYSPAVINQSYVPPPSAPGIPPPPIRGPIPLNAHSSNFAIVNRKYENRWCFCFGLAVIIAFGMFVMILSSVLVR